MTDILTTADLLNRGYDHDDVERLQSRGELVRIRRGAYMLPPDETPTAEVRHRQLIEATMPQLQRDGVVSHLSAAVLHGLPVWATSLDRVQLTRTRLGGGRTRSIVQVHTSPLPADEVVSLDGARVTSLARTVVDLARTLPLDQSVAAADHALTLGLDRLELAEVAERVRGWPGAGRARFLATFADPRSESVGESVSRLRLHEAMLPPPVPQYEVRGPRGELVGRADFAWEEQRVLGEFDGRIKYGRLLKPGETPEQAVYREKRREDALRELGWLVIRWSWADLHQRGLWSRSVSDVPSLAPAGDDGEAPPVRARHPL